MGLHPDDAFYGDRSEVVGLTGQVSGDLHVNDGCWLGGGGRWQVAVVYRGRHCPLCRKYLKTLDGLLDDFHEAGAEVVATRLFHALGYHVPDNTVVYFGREALEPAEGSTYTTPLGQEEALTPAFVDSVLARVPSTADGRYRALASRYLEGEPVGPFRYQGTRPDDPNDVYPHEARRELRGMVVPAALVNHYDARAANTLDMYVEEDGRRYVRHHLIDFGSTLGAGPSAPASGRGLAHGPMQYSARSLRKSRRPAASGTGEALKKLSSSSIRLCANRRKSASAAIT